jgi:cytoskeletal protein CcmA (bactofilin family)/ribosomal protein S27E
VAKSPAKVSVECPHCGFKQLEYQAARSTLCRHCGKHFEVSAAAVEPKSTGDPAESVATPSLFHRLGGMWTRSRISSVACFDCGTVQELTSAATSTICRSCSLPMDLRDYKITNSFSRNIRTHGEIHITSSGDLNSNNIVCGSAIIDGKLRGNLHCVDKAEFRIRGKIHGKLTALQVVIGKKADVQFFRQLHVGSIEIRGAMVGEIVAATAVTIRSTGSLDGNIVARAINVEKGGRFSGQLMIGGQTLQQAELLPDVESKRVRSEGKARPRRGATIVLPATS